MIKGDSRSPRRPERDLVFPRIDGRGYGRAPHGETAHPQHIMPMLISLEPGITNLHDIGSGLLEGVFEAAIEIKPGVVVPLGDEAARGIADRHQGIGVLAKAIGHDLEPNPLSRLRLNLVAVARPFAKDAPYGRRLGQRRLLFVHSPPTNRQVIDKEQMQVAKPVGGGHAHPAHANGGVIRGGDLENRALRTGLDGLGPEGSRGQGVPDFEGIGEVFPNKCHPRRLAAFHHGRADMFNERLGRHTGGKRQGQGQGQNRHQIPRSCGNHVRCGAWGGKNMRLFAGIPLNVIL